VKQGEDLAVGFADKCHTADEGYAEVTQNYRGLQRTESKSAKMVEAGGVGIFRRIENK
jgi:hypothetical protein